MEPKSCKEIYYPAMAWNLKVARKYVTLQWHDTNVARKYVTLQWQVTKKLQGNMSPYNGMKLMLQGNMLPCNGKELKSCKEIFYPTMASN